MQTQSRLSAVSGGSSGLDSADEHEALVRELTRGRELTARLQAEALRALRGQGQAEATAAFILGEVSRAFTLCISIMGGSASAAPAPRPKTPESSVSVGMRRARDDGIPRKTKVTSSPHSDGYQWRKYGQKRIMKTSFPRCYYRCNNHRGRNCPVTKQVQQQQHSNGDRPLYLVIYVHEHTCHTPPADQPEAVAHGAATDPLVGFSGLSRQGAGVHDIAMDRGAKEERERQALVSSLACVLQQGRQYSAGGAPEGPSQGRRAGDGASASAALADASGLHEALDIMDYGVTDTVYFGASPDGLRDNGMLF